MKKGLLLVFVLLRFLQSSTAQCNLNCPPNLNVSLPPNSCTRTFTPLDFLNNPTVGCTYKLVFDYPLGTNHPIPATTLDLSHTGYTMIYRIYDSLAASPVYCWGNIKVNYCNPCAIKTPPILTSFTASAGPYIPGGTVTLTATATDNISISKIEFYKGYQLIKRDFTSPYTAVDTFGSTYATENHYRAIAYDNCGDTAISPYLIIRTLFPTCTDNIKNGFETGVDCGGSVCPACPFVCSTPTNLAASVYGSLATLSWTGSTAQYQIEIVNTVTNAVVVSNSYVTSPYQISIVDGSYKFRVRSMCSGYTFSNWSIYAFFNVNTYNPPHTYCNVPTNLWASNTYGQQVSLSWSGSAYQYEIQIDTAYSYGLIFSGLVPSSPYHINLQNGKYRFKVRSVCSGVYSVWSDWVWFNVGISPPPPPPPHYEPCTAPTYLSVTVVDKYAKMTWQGSASQYQITVENATTGESIVSAGISNKFFEISLPSGNYRFRVRSVCGYDFSVWSTWSLFSVYGDHPYNPEHPYGGGPVTGCNTPTQLGASMAGQQANLKWTGSSPQYQIIVENIGTNETVASAGIVVSSFQLNLPNGNYRFRVRSQCGSDYSDWSAWTPFSIPIGSNPGNNPTNPPSGDTPPPPPPPLVCDAPTQLTSFIIGQQIKLSWTGVSGSYLIEIKNSITKESLVNEIPTTNPYQGTLTEGIYKFRVKSDCSSKQSEWSNWAFFIIGGVNIIASDLYIPLDPTCANGVAARLSQANSTSITLKWNPINATATYLIEVIQEDAPGSYRYVVDGFKGSEITFTGLIANTKYKVMIKAKCGNGYSSVTNITNTATPPVLPYSPGVSKFNCDVPTGLTISIVSATSVQLSWVPVYGIKSYKVSIESKSPTPSLSQTQNVLINSYLLTDLSPGGSYQFKVSAACNFSNSVASAFTSFTLPSNLIAEPILESREAPQMVSFELYPNPTKSNLNIMIPRTVEFIGSVQIFNTNGQLIHELKNVSADKTISLDVQRFLPGVYFVRLKSGTSHQVKKLIIE